MMEDIQREENESEVDYFKRAILILQANINKLVIQNSENEERLKREAAENGNKSLLMQLIGQLLTDVGMFEIDVPDSIVFCHDVVSEAIEIVRDFNAMPDTIEKSGSIAEANSMHFLWSKLIRIVQKSIIPLNKGRRVVYEWGIQHPTKNSTQEIDFTFIPSETSYLNWSNYRGGIEVKINPPSSKKNSKSGSSAAGKVATDGRLQALSRAAMCVFSRWKDSGFAEEHRAFCCYADGRSLSVARVHFKDGKIVGETTEPILLPGFQGCDNPHALRLLAHLLQSDEYILTDLISAPNTLPSIIEGKLFSSKTREVWHLGEFLGFGGFGIVHCELTDPVDRYTSYVIKSLENSLGDSTLSKEHKALQKLNDASTELFPVVADALLSEATEVVVALKLYPRGLTVSSFLRATGNVRYDIKHLVKAMCPVIIKALKLAHNINISHCDIRDSNILIVPPADFMRIAIDSIDDPIATHNLYLSLSLDTCKFILNDWGNATNLSTANRNEKIKSDLEMLILVVMRLGGCIDLSLAMKKPCQPVPRLDTDGNQLSSENFSSHLMDLVAAADYEALSSELVQMFS